MLKITKHYGRYGNSHNLQFKGRGWISVSSVPKSRLYNDLGFYECNISDINIANMKCEELFGCSLELVTHTLLFESVWGLDRSGLYLYRSWDYHHHKRPKRMRPNLYVENIMQRILKGEEFKYPTKPVLLYECSCCKRRAEKSGWNWSSMPGLANSEYITNCPQCDLRQGNILDSIRYDVARTKRLQIVTKWSHGKQFVWSGTERTIPVFVNDCDFRNSPRWQKKFLTCDSNTRIRSS